MAFDLVGKAVKKIRLPTVNYDNSPIKIIPAQCGDVNSRFFEIEMYDDRGDIDVSHYDTVILNATLPDGSLQIAEGEIREEAKIVVCKIAGSMLSQSGKITCDVSLSGVDSSGEAMKLTSQTFYIFAAASQSNENAIEGNDNYDALTQLLYEVSQLEAEISSAEQSRVSAEEQRVDEFSSMKADCENATANANAAYEAVESVLDVIDSLPCQTEIVESGVSEAIISLKFIKLED